MFNIFEKCKGCLLYSLSGGRLLLENKKSILLEITILPIISAIISIIFGSVSSFLALIAINLVILAVETLNSVIEKIRDLITKERNQLIKYAKDTGSFAVIYSIYTILT